VDTQSIVARDLNRLAFSSLSGISIVKRVSLFSRWAATFEGKLDTTSTKTIALSAKK